MDWRRFYATDAAGEAGREAVRIALDRWGDGDPVVAAVLRAGGIASFPHTMLRESADPIARVAVSIVAAGFQRVVALGVLHGGTLREAERDLLAELVRNGPRADEAFERLGGAFVTEPEPELAAGAPWIRADPALLANEFSLDLFDRVLAEAARLRRVAPPRVTRVFVGPTRAADGTFAAGTAVARGVAPLVRAGAACVATGDLVHFGNGYASDAEVAALPRDADVLTAHFAARVTTMLDAAFREGRVGAAYGISTSELRSDQRNLLPVLVALAGQGARPEVLSFRMADYGPVLGEPPPCVVGSALYVVRPRAEAPSSSADLRVGGT